MTITAPPGCFNVKEKTCDDCVNLDFINRIISISFHYTDTDSETDYSSLDEYYSDDDSDTVIDINKNDNVEDSNNNNYISQLHANVCIYCSCFYITSPCAF